MNKRISLAFISVIIAVVIFLSAGCSDEFLEQRALHIHEKVLTLDLHVDTPLILTLDSRYDLSVRNDPFDIVRKVDFTRMQEGGLDAVFFAVFVQQGPRTQDGYRTAKATALNMLQIIHENLTNHSDLAALALNPLDAYRIKQEGRRAVFIGMENGYPIGNDLSLIQYFYDLGVRYITLCHSTNNDICDSSTDPSGPEHVGLSGFGREVIAEMNRVGMMIDVSHISDQAFYDVLEETRAPVIASHSCTRAVYNHPRNLDDKMLRRLAENGGVIHIAMLYVTDDRFASTLSDFVDHIDHAVAVAGINHVGIGSDFDGGGSLQGCYDVSEMMNITIELVKRGYTFEQIQKIWSGNFMRVFTQVRSTSERIRKIEKGENQ